MKINHNQLTFVREYRGYSQTDLSSMIEGLSQPNLSKFEKGFDTLSIDVIERIMKRLDFPMEFLSKNISNESNTAHYRKRTTISKKNRTEIEQNYKLIGYLVDEMAESLEWPQFTFPTIDLEDGYTPSDVAQHIRRFLKLKPNEPIIDICNTVEVHGIIIIETDSHEKFDGVSLVSDFGYPIIVINKNFSNDRKRFTIAHELGHLLMHSVNNPAIPSHRKDNLENEADKFASEFLMPESGIKKSLYNLGLRDLAELKRYWRTSMASIARRAYDLGCIDKSTYVYFNIELSRINKSGQKKNEGIEVSIDPPVLFKKGYLLHINELNYSDSELAEGFKLPKDIIIRYFQDPHKNDNHPKLRVVA
jgi:Zn-dependent peptidase ImmA (M78 family)